MFLASQSVQIALADLSLAVTIAGEGPPLLLLHGFTGRAAAWAHHLPALAGLRRVIAPDLIGHGASDAPADPERYTLERCAADLLAMLDQLAVGRFDLLGYSMGGRVALHLALAAPERVRTLILESASPGIRAPEERSARRAADEALAARIEGEGLVAFVDHWERLPLFAGQANLPAELRAAQRAIRLSHTAHGLACSLRGMGAGRQEPLWERLGELSMPALLISGELDEKYCAITRQISALMPQAQVVIVPAAGHTVHLEHPETYRELVRSFLQQQHQAS